MRSPPFLGIFPPMSWVDILNQGHPCKKVSRNKTQLKGTKTTTPKPAKFWIRHLQSNTCLFPFLLFLLLKTNENEAKEQEIIPILEFYHFWRDSKFNTLSFFHIGESSRSPSPMRSFRNRNVGEGTTLLVKRSSAAGSKRKTFMCSAWLLANLFPRKFHGISTWDTPGGSRIFSHHLSLHVQ